jgi:hypothetical protein
MSAVTLKATRLRVALARRDFLLRELGKFIQDLLQSEFSVALCTNLQWRVKVLVEVLFICSAKLGDLQLYGLHTLADLVQLHRNGLSHEDGVTEVTDTRSFAINDSPAVTHHPAVSRAKLKSSCGGGPISSSVLK